MAQPKIVADFETSLATAISIGSTQFTLSSVTDKDGVTLANGEYYFTIDNGASNKEYFLGTLNNATKVVSSIYTVTRQAVETANAARAHRIGAPVILTDFATYKKYIDAIALAGTVDASTTGKGVVEEATQAEIDAGTTAGATGAQLFVNPAKIRAKAYHDYAADAVGTDSYAITVTPAITAYATGQVFTFKVGTANTGAATLAVSGLSAITIKKDYNLDLATGDLVANRIVQVVYDGTNFQLMSSVASTVPVVRTYLNAASPATWTKPTGLKYVVVEVQAGGGGGGGSTLAGRVSGGGGGGGYAKETILATSLGATETVTIGAGGAGSGTTTGSTGGTSSFGSLVSATGGLGGEVSSGIAVPGGVGGAGSGGDVNLLGRNGGQGTRSTPSMTGVGGDSFLGFGGVSQIYTASVNGLVGGLYGGGGSGSGNEDGSDQVGGSGAAGIVIVTEYY